MADFPTQPTVVDTHGVSRFVANRIVRDLLEGVMWRDWTAREVAIYHRERCAHE